MKKAMLLITAMLALSGCPDGGKSNRLNNNQYAYGSCVNCGFTQASFSQSVSSELPQGVLTLSINGDLGQMNNLATHQQNPLFAYQGPVALGGTLQLNSEIYLGMCRLPVGTYSLRTLQAGSYDRGVFQAPSVELVGPARALVSISEGVILTNGNGVIIGFGAVMRGQSGPSVWGVMGGYQPYNGYAQQSACGDTVGVRF